MLFCSWGEWGAGAPLFSVGQIPVIQWAWSEASLKGPDKGVSLLLSCTFFFILLFTAWQVTPGSFVAVSHISVTGALAFPLWSMMVLSSMMTCTNQLLASLVPAGAPGALVPGLVVVEVFSHAMRPVALCARLSLTTMTGHIILGLVWGISSELLVAYLSCPGVEAWAEVSLVLSGVNAFLVLAELGISVLQAYIFFTLLLFFATQYPVGQWVY
uniref:ATP synthase F0 subunit 6 n=1 Tax=Patelloida saccharinoides TaxID=225156 RepID=UPI0023D8435D|nr:ATP synthase F0 subunit 6 [Patelloida saccharinoides]WCR50865.1 ATP synthase F0 subunit 6 [Patelloida saccharinoides]